MSLAGIDSYVTGSHYSSLGNVPHVCVNGHLWTATLFSEYGGSFYEDDNDAICPICKEEGMEEYQIKNMMKKLKDFEKLVKSYRKVLGKFDDDILKAQAISMKKRLDTKSIKHIDSVNGLPVSVCLEMTQDELMSRQEKRDQELQEKYEKENN